METAMPATLWRVRSSMAWWGGRRCRDGALKHAGWAREGWWPWLRRRRRRALLGGVRGRVGRLRAAAWRLHAWIGSKGEASSAKQEVAGVDARHASPLLVLLAEEEEDKGGGGGLGRLGELGRLWWLRG